MSVAIRFGFLSALGLFAVGIAYIVVVAIGVSQAGLSSPIRDPILAVMEVLTLLSALLLLILMAAIREYATEERRLFGTLALTFAGIMTGLTCAVHFVTLTAGRQTDFTVLEWPSGLYAVELLAWDVFLGLSLLFAAFVFTGSRFHSAVRWVLVLSGSLALIGTIGPINGNMALQRLGILGYGFGLPIAALMLAVLFRRDELRP